MLPSKSTSRVALRLARFVSCNTAALLLLILLAPSPVRAQTEVWTGLSDSNWSNPLNWNPDTAYPNNTDAVAEFTTENGRQIYQIGLGGDIAVGTLDLDSSDFHTIGNPSDSYALTFSASSGSASLNSGANNPTVPQTINAPLMLNSDLNINLSNTVAFNGSITGDFGVVLSGIGDLVLNAAMNVTKGFTIGKDDNTPANVTLSNMERLGSGPLTVNKMGVLDVNGQQGNGFPTVPSISGSGTVTSSAAGGSFTVNNTLGSTFSGQFTGSLDLFKLGTGTLTLGGQSSYTGMTSIGGGTVKAGTNNCLPTGTTLSIASLAPAPNSVFDLNGFNQTIAGIASTTGGGVITNSNNAGNATTFTMTNATGTIGASFQGNLNLVTGGSGTLTLAPVNTYTGGTIVTDGTLQLAPRGASAPANPNALPATTALGLLPGTKLDCNGNNVTVTGISGDNSTQIVNSSTLFRSNLTINTPANTNSSFAGSFVSNEAAGAIVGQLAKTGSGTLVLSGAASYNGFDIGVNGGTLTYNTPANIQVNNPMNATSVGTGATLNGTGFLPGSVNLLASGGGTLAGTLTIGGLGTINNGTISPAGSGTAGTLTFNNGLTIDAGTNNASTVVYNWDLTALKDNADLMANPMLNAWDMLNVPMGAFNLGKATLSLNFSGGATAPAAIVPFWTMPHMWDIITLGNIMQNPNGPTSFTAITGGNSTAGYFTTQANANNGVTLVYTPGAKPIPEPAGFSALAILSACLLARRRSRQLA